MDFEKIILSHSEKRFLRRSKNHSVPVSKCRRLLQFGLVYEPQTASPGELPIGTGFCRISDTGINYLMYWKDRWLSRFVIPIIVSIITTISTNIILALLTSSIPPLLQLIQELIQ